MASRNKAQRIGIWIIAIVMTAGTIGSFAVIILQNDNAKIDQTQQEKAYEEYLAQQKIQAQANADNSEGFGDYKPRTFEASKVSKLQVSVLKSGSGETIKATDTINVSYFGWLSTGEIFDSSKKKGEDDAPITFSLANVISGWTKGLTGVKEGSVVRLTIPAEEAYGVNESGIIPASSPLEFIVEIHKIDNSGTGA